MSPYILRTFSAMLLPNLKMKFYVFQDGYIIIYKVLYIYIYIHTYCQRTRCVSWICKLIKCIKISYQMNPDEKSMLTNITSPTKPVLTSLKKMGWKTSPPTCWPNIRWWLSLAASAFIKAVMAWFTKRSCSSAQRSLSRCEVLFMKVFSSSLTTVWCLETTFLQLPSCKLIYQRNIPHVH